MKVPLQSLIIGSYGVVGQSVLNLMFSTTWFNNPKSFGILGPVATGPDNGVIGDFAVISDIIDNWFTDNYGILYSGGDRNRQAVIIGGDTFVPNLNLLDLDWAKDGQPFAWAASGPPSLMTLDWVLDAQPFATNDTDPVVAASAQLLILAGTSTIPSDFTVIFAQASFQILASTVFDTASIIVVEAVAADLSIDASSKLTSRIVSTTSAGLSILATVANTTIRVVSLVSAAILIRAISTVVLSKRTVKPCEVPGTVIHLTSNLPYGIWQQNPDAIFTWDSVITCAKTPTGQELVYGYYWVIDHNPATIPSYDGNFTVVPNAEIHLDDTHYGSGDWWFHVVAVNWAGLGTVASYNVRYNNIPSEPGTSGMWVNGFDSLLHNPIIAYHPVTPHQFTWSVSNDLDESPTIVYEIQICLSPDFSINPGTGLTEIVLDAENIQSALYNLTQVIAPGHYYWRVQASDGNQVSAWSPTAHFQVNNPPDAPYDLSVYQTG